ncbi:MAG: dTDP-4-dehydrorhamnose reductase [Actinomycetota bacterium]|nr:dTDP-4-dehydrorhamnose reductase [Actinomycetota bacterium]
MTRWLVTGAHGQLGRDLVRQLAGHDVLALTRTELDLREEGAVRAAVGNWLAAGSGDAVIVNTAAYTAVDAAETDEAAALIVNGRAPGWIAEAAGGRARLIHISTDYVFAGDATTPYEPGDPTGPRTAYGRTKLAGERAVLAADPDAYVIRTAWVFAGHGTNFVRTMLRLERETDTVRVVDDQLGSPTWTRHLADALVELAGSGARAGVYHCVGAGSTSWRGLAAVVFQAVGADPDRVLPVSTTEFPRPAPRPAYSVLSTRAWQTAGLTALPPWRDGVLGAVDAVLDRG